VNDLGAKAAAKVVSAVARMEAGNFGGKKSVAEGVRERRIDFEKGYRIYFGKDGDESRAALLEENDEEPVSDDFALAEEGGRESQGCSR